MAAGAFEVGSIVAKVGFDVDESGKSRFDRAYDATQAKASRDIVAHATIDVDTAQSTRNFQDALEQMRAKAKAAQVTVEAKVDVDTSGRARFDRAVDDMRAKAARPIVAHATVDTDVDRASGRFIDSMGKMREANGRFVKTTADGFERVKDGIEDVDQSTQRHNRSGLNLTKTYQSLNRAASALPRPLQLVANAVVAFARAGSAVGQTIGGSGGGVIGGIIGLVGGLGGLGGAIGIVLILLSQLVGALVAVVASAAAAAAGLAALGAGFAAAFGPFLLIGVQVVARITAMTQAYRALSDENEKGGTQAKAVAGQHRQAAQAIQQAEQGLADARRTGDEAVKRARQQLDDARRTGAKSVADAERELANVTEQSANDRDQALDDLVAAREQGLAQVTAAQRDADDARVQGAEDVQHAEQDLADAQAGVLKAQHDLTEARKDAARQTEDLAAADRHAALSEEGAQLTLREAKKRLAEVKADPRSTQLDLDEANHAVKEAQAGIDDARTAKRRADEDAAAGTTKVRDATDALTQARVAATKAEQDLGSIRRQSTIAVERADIAADKARQDSANQTAAAQAHVSDVVTAGARAQQDAQRKVGAAVADAARATTRAAADVAKARADESRSVERAAEAVARARQSAADSAGNEGAAATTAQQKLAQLDDTERRLLTTVRSFVRGFSSAMRPATDAIFDGVDDALTSVTPLLDRYKGRFGRIGEGIGDLIRNAGKSLSGPEWTHALDTFVATAEHITKPLGEAFGSAIEIVRNIAVAAQPYVREVADGIRDAVGDIADRTSDAGRMSEIIAGLLKHTKSWFDLLVDVGKLIFTIFDGGADSGRKLVDQLDGVVRKWTAFLETDEGQRKMRKFFEDSVRFARNLATGIYDVVSGLIKVGNFFRDHIGLIRAATEAWILYKAASKFGLIPAALPTPTKPGVGGVGATVGGVAKATLYGAAAVGGITALTQAIRGPSGTDVGLVNKYADALERVVRTGDRQGMRDLARQFRETATANQDLTKGENLKRFADALEATAATGGRNLNALSDAFSKLPESVGGNIEKVRRELAKLAGDRSIDDVGKTLRQAEKHFDDFRRTGSNNLHGIHTATADNMHYIKRVLGDDSEAGKAALVQNFKLAERAVQDAMSDGKVATADGMREIKRLMKEELAVYGIKGQQATDYLRTEGHGSGNEAPRGGHQRGGYVQRRQSGGWIGARGMVSDDVVPIGDNAIAALGEYLAVGPDGQKAVINRHQAPVADLALGMAGYGSLDSLPSGSGLPIIERALEPFGGLDTLFATIDRPHNYARGGRTRRYARGGRLQLPENFTPTHQTAGLPGYAAIDVFGTPGTPVGAPADGLISRFSGRSPSAGAYMGPGGPFGWSIYLNSRDSSYFLTHFGSRSVNVGQKVRRGQTIGTVGDYPGAVPDHIHEGKHDGTTAASTAASGASGSGGAARPAPRPIRVPKVIGGGALGGVVQGALNTVGRAANQSLSSAAGSSSAGGSSAKALSANADVVAAFRRAIKARHASPVERLALWEAGIVESGLRNLPYGDRDSLGSLQERTSIYGAAHAMNPYASAIRFLSQVAAKRPWRGSAGSLAQSAQGSRYPDRYDAVAGQARRYLAGGGRVPSATSSSPQRTGGGTQTRDSGSLAIGRLRSMQTGRIGDFDDWMAAADRKQNDYAYHDRRFSITVEELIDPETGQVDVAQVKRRANELIQLSIDAQQRTEYLKKAREIARRVVTTYRTILERLRRARTHTSGNRTFQNHRRSYYDGQITKYAASLTEWTGKIPGLSSTIRDSELDISEVAKEYQEVIGTKATPSDAGADDTGAGADAGTGDTTPDDPIDTDNSQALADQTAIADQANARAAALAAQVGVQEQAIRTLGGSADFGVGGRNALAAAGGSGLPSSLAGVGTLGVDVLGNPIATGGGTVVVQRFEMLAAPRDPATLRELGSAAVAGLDYNNPKSSPRVDSPL